MKSLRRIGSVDARARGAEVLERAAEARSLGQHRQRRRAAALVGADDVLQLEIVADHAGRRRAALVLGDHRQAGPGQRLGERPQLGRRRAVAVSAPTLRAATSSSRRSADRPGCARRSAPARSRVGRQAAGCAHEPLERGGGGARVDRPLGGPRRPARASRARRRRRSRRRALSTARSRAAPGSPAKIRRAVSAFCCGSPPGTASAGARSQADLLGRDVYCDSSPSGTSNTQRRRRDAELVEAVLAADQQRVLGAEQRQRAGHRLEVGRVRDPDQLARGARRGWSAARGS